VKVLWVQMVDLYLIFRFVKGRCNVNQMMLAETRKQWRQTDTTCIFFISVWKWIGISIGLCAQ